MYFWSSNATIGGIVRLENNAGYTGGESVFHKPYACHIIVFFFFCGSNQASNLERLTLRRCAPSTTFAAFHGTPHRSDNGGVLPVVCIGGRCDSQEQLGDLW